MARDRGGSRARRLGGIWSEPAAIPPIEEERKIGYLGVAHGWAGLIHTALRWRKPAGGQLPPGVETRLSELAASARLSSGPVEAPRAALALTAAERPEQRMR